MAQVLNQFNNQIQNIPLYNQVTGLYENQVGERFSTKDPFYEKVPKKDQHDLQPGEKMEYKEIRRKPPPNISEKQRKLWKRVMKRAWYHDRNLCGCMPIDLGCGMISVVSILPIIGSAIAYNMHYKMIKLCNEAGCPKKIQAEMVGNIGLDFAMTLVPLLGVVLSWMKASSTRNAALFDTWLRQQSYEKDEMLQRQNHQQSKLQRPGQGQGGSGPSRPSPVAAQAPPTQSQQQQPHSRGAKAAPRGSGAVDENAAPTGQQPPNGAAVPLTQTRGAPQRRPVPNQGHQSPRAQGPPQSGAPARSISTSPINSPPTSPPPYQNRAPSQRVARVPVQPRSPPPETAPPAQPGPPLPPKIPANEARRIPPAGTYDFSNRGSNGSPYGSARSSLKGSAHSPIYGSPPDSPYGSPNGSPYRSQAPPTGGSSYGNLGYGKMPPRQAPPVGYAGPHHLSSHKTQKFFMQPAVRAQPEVVEL